jgi:hypothetical protein
LSHGKIGRGTASPHLNRVAWVVLALDLVVGANIAIVGLDMLACLVEVPKELVEDLDVGELSGWIGTLDQHQVPTQNANPNLVPEGRLARVLVGGKPVAGGPFPCLRGPKIRPIDWHEAVITYVTILVLLEVNLQWRGKGGGAGHGGRGEMTMTIRMMMAATSTLTTTTVATMAATKRAHPTQIILQE